MTLNVWPPVFAPLGHERRHLGDVGLHDVQIDAECGGVEIEFVGADECLSHERSSFKAEGRET